MFWAMSRRIFCVAALASAVRVQSGPLPTGVEAFLERLRPGLGTLAPVLTGYGLETEADFAQLRFDDVAAEEVWALLEANGCHQLRPDDGVRGLVDGHGKLRDRVVGVDRGHQGSNRDRARRE